jgi:hypothetical protein
MSRLVWRYGQNVTKSNWSDNLVLGLVPTLEESAEFAVEGPVGDEELLDWTQGGGMTPFAVYKTLSIKNEVILWQIEKMIWRNSFHDKFCWVVLSKSKKKWEEKE